jgi:predicted dehydrogenase
MPENGPLRVGIAGGRRGTSFRRACGALPERVQVSAICDRDPAVLEDWRREAPEARPFQRMDDLLAAGSCDAIVLATPLLDHARQASAALDAGLHVLSEVIAATAPDEAWALIEAVRRSGRVYMMAENYCYTRPAMMVRHMVERGLFGQPTYAEGAYVHDTRNLLFTAAGELTWRGEIARDQVGNAYPTHSFGPIAQWLGVAGPEASDRCVELVAFSTPDASRWRYAAERFGTDHPAAIPGFFSLGDSASVLVRTARGAIAYLRRDAASPRPHNMTHYGLQGTAGAYLAPRHRAEEPLVWLTGRSPGSSPGDASWESLWSYAEEFEHPRWRELGQVAAASGHGGGDFLVTLDFLDAVQRGRPPGVDVYDALTWSSVYWLSADSIRRGSVPVPIPSFRGAP